MSVAAVLDPTTLLGKELRELLGNRPGWDDVRLLASQEEGVGAIVEVGGAAALVGRYEPGALSGVDVAFFCGDVAAARPVLPELPPETTAVVLATDATVDDGRPIVVGVNDGAAENGRALLSPHPAVILLAHVLHPLRGLGLEEAVATVVQPASMHGEAGIDELFQQTRNILAMQQQQRASPIFGGQLAFNLLPVPAPADPLAAELRAVLAGEPPVSLQVVQGGVFHSLAASLYVRAAGRAGVKAVRRALGQNPRLELAKHAGRLGPIDAAVSEKVIVGDVHEETAPPGGLWLWAVMDNLTRGGALNAVEVAEAVL
jgi:aspartate-semialdehyde dehydrogenase